MKRKIFIIIMVILVLVVGSLIVFLNSNYYYSKKLVLAIKEENVIAVQQIVEKKPNCINTYPSITSKWWQSAMNQRVCYPLNAACDTGNLDIIKLLIENGADVNCNDGLTPLSITYSSKVDNWYVISQILIKNGASLNYTTEYSGEKSSVLQDIVQNRPGSSLPGYEPDNNEEVIKSFNYALENCDRDIVNWMQVLQNSVSNNRIEIVKLLLEQNYCDVNDTTVGVTALMFATRDANFEMVKFLLDYGADKSIKSSDGKTAYDYALESGDEDIISILED